MVRYWSLTLNSATRIRALWPEKNSLPSTAPSRLSIRELLALRIYLSTRIDSRFFAGALGSSACWRCHCGYVPRILARADHARFRCCTAHGTTAIVNRFLGEAESWPWMDGVMAFLTEFPRVIGSGSRGLDHQHPT